MGLMGAILAGIGVICAALGVITILDFLETPIINAKLTWEFWFWISAILFLAAITSLLGRKPGGGD
jgi:hypothetical protein